MSNRPRRNLSAVLAPLTMIVSAVLVSGCGNDKLSDEAYGFIDLAPYYYDGSSAANPSAGLPREIAPTKGWLNNARAEYYDFGLVGAVKKRSDTRLIDYAAIPAMYFFFDDGGGPLFSKPVFESRTGLWHMRGGVDVLNPNPSGGAKKDVPYSVRTRQTIGSFQRPIIDRLQHNTDYSGLWEIWEVQAPGGYEVDSIKSYATLKKGIDDGSFVVRRTKKVINCPVLDDRQYVTPSPLYYGIPHPRIELWYRTKQGSCFLSDGWMTLADGPTTDAKLIRFNQDAKRLQMFDTISYTIGSGEGARTTIVAPVSKMFIPTAYVATLDTRAPTQLRYSNDNVTDVMPRYSDADPPGYRPIRWLWDLQVPQDPPYKPATYRSVAQMDPVSMINRQGPFTKNFPTIGVSVSCTIGGDPVCDPLPHAPNVAALACVRQFGIARSPIDGTAISGIADDPWGPRCDVPQGRFGEFCAPAIAGCQYEVNDKTPGPDFDFVTMNKADNGGTLTGGYTCQPNTSAGGYCVLRCDSDASSSDSKETEEISVKYKGPDGQEKVDKGKYMGYDKRCGNLPGYKCLNPAGTVPTTQRVCLRSCDGGKPDTFNDVYCAIPMTDAINDRVGGKNIQAGQKCTTRGLTGASACQWDPAYEPRPSSTFNPL